MVQTKIGGNLIGKISCYLQIVSKDPHSTAFVPLAEAFRQVGLLDDALTAARLGTQALPNFSPGFATMGRVLAQMGRFDEAMSAYCQALAIDRQSLSALAGLVRLHLARGEHEQARKILIQSIEFHPEDEMLGNMLLALDLPRPWTGAPSAGVAAEPPPAAAEVPGVESAVAEGAPIPTATLAEIYVGQGLVEQAVKVYEEILRMEPGNAAALARLKELRPPAEAEAALQVTAEAALPVTASSAAPAVLPAAHEVPAAPRAPREVFEGWLEVIARRRVHVR